MSAFTLYPAIDVRERRVVRLRQGDYAQETRYDDAPLVVAQRYAAQGAQWLHLVDLDAARSGGYTLQPLLRAIRQSTSLRVQTGGGMRSEDDVRALLDAGADRVVIGSMAVEDPALVRGWLDRFGPERLTIALDTRRGADGRWRLPSRGWTADRGIDLDAMLQAYAPSGLRHLLCTDIGRDGMLAGPNTPLYAHILQVLPSVRLQASGGVRGLEDVLAARALGCGGVVLGKALLEGRVALEQAASELAAC
jgi:phosphoribosylformimino-5-aminoimidazole carboxamide ribotide isomerase